METSEILSAFVDGEAADTAALAAALAEPGARETLIDFVRLRAALAGDDSRPSDTFVQRMRSRLGGRVVHAAPRLLRFVAALAIAALATVGAYDLLRGLRPQRPDEPPKATRVIRFEPGVDWKPVEGRP